MIVRQLISDPIPLLQQQHLPFHYCYKVYPLSASARTRSSSNRSMHSICSHSVSQKVRFSHRPSFASILHLQIGRPVELHQQLVMHLWKRNYSIKSSFYGQTFTIHSQRLIVRHSLGRGLTTTNRSLPFFDCKRTFFGISSKNREAGKLSKEQINAAGTANSQLSSNAATAKCLEEPPSKKSERDLQMRKQDRQYYDFVAKSQHPFSLNNEEAKTHVEQARARANLPSFALSALGLDEEEVTRELFQRSKSAKSDIYMRCTEIDENGRVRMMSGEVKKTELCTKHGLLPRDLRKLDAGISTIVPTLLIRQNSILINLLHIRALIKSDLVLLFDEYGTTDSLTQSLFIYDLEGKLQQNSKSIEALPYEMRALEAILISVTTSLDAELRVLSSIVEKILHLLEEGLNRDELRHLLLAEKRLSNFGKKATLIRDAIDEVLEQDDDLVGMYLTEKSQGVHRREDQHDEIELLLESYLKQVDEIVQRVDNLHSSIKSTQEIVNIILDAQRNVLMLFSLRVSIAAMGISAGAFIGALFGMNLRNYFETSDYGFVTVCGISLLVICTIIGRGLRMIRLKQRKGLLKAGWAPFEQNGSHRKL